MIRTGAGFVILAAAALGGCGQDAVGVLTNKAEEAVRNATRDPDAVKFRDVEVCSKDRAMVTGQFNGKNAYGGYAGFEPFLYSQDGAVTTTDDDSFLRVLDQCYGSNTEVDEPRS